MSQPNIVFTDRQRELRDIAHRIARDPRRVSSLLAGLVQLPIVLPPAVVGVTLHGRLMSSSGHVHPLQA